MIRLSVWRWGVVLNYAAGTASSSRVYTDKGMWVRVTGGPGTEAGAGSDGGPQGKACGRPLGAGKARKQSLLQTVQKELSPAGTFILTQQD